MHERAASIGARLGIESELGQRTRVTVIWSHVEREKGSHEHA
jgi:signal transduction histidine kinase